MSRIQAAAHEDQFFRQTREFRIDGDGERKIGHRAALVDRDLMRILVDHAHQKVCGVFV